ncbi:DMT family transporter [Paenibacillus sp. JX-17]|uniref:DMT family transporter n=1 Tax=Paenibacillus lacisoli TaxID=3064525 RepID=A0ABT9C8P3_9BACL|nr:DMT family transporter [Paenibacillus sp. JX-17]MDO7905631.1 DMT family transporter [Paenibacillus sp. JX-17]
MLNKYPAARVPLMLGFLIVVWGLNWPLSKLALHYTPPLLFAGIRTLIGGLVLLLFALRKREQLRFRQNWPLYLISALLNIVCFYGLQTVGLGYLPSGLFSSIVFLQPVLLGLFSWLWLGEAMYSMKVAGLVLGFVGVATISAGAISQHVSTIGVVLALGTAVSWAFGAVYMKKTSHKVDSTWMVCLQLLMGGALLTAAGSATESWAGIQWTGSFVGDLLFIAVFVIAFGWLTYFILMGSGEASKVGSFTFLIPLVSIFGSSLMMGEPITVNLVVGLLLVLVSICLVNIKPRALKTVS